MPRPRPAALGLVPAALLAGAVTIGCGSSAHAHGTALPGASHVSGRTNAARGSGRAHARAASGGESARVRSLIALGRPIYCGARRGDEVALTFDDGPGPYTRLVLAKLHKHHVAATFFDVGRNIPLLPAAPREERAAGALGDHTFNHPLLTALGGGEADAEVARTQLALERASGSSVFLFRPPYGGRDAAIDQIARAHGLLEVMWTVDSADSLGANYAQIERNVIGGLRGGAIVLMHENHGQTVRALLGIFAALQRLHLRAVSVPRLLTDDPPSAAQVRAGGAGCGLRATGLGGG